MYDEEPVFDHEPFMDSGACRKPQHDPDWWFSGDATVIRHAKEICETQCTVREQCLEWALRKDHKHSIAGGLTRLERKAMTRRV